MKLDKTCLSAPKYVHLPHRHAHSSFHLLFYESSFSSKQGLNCTCPYPTNLPWRIDGWQNFLDVTLGCLGYSRPIICQGFQGEWMRGTQHNCQFWVKSGSGNVYCQHYLCVLSFEAQLQHVQFCSFIICKTSAESDPPSSPVSTFILAQFPIACHW